MEPDGTFRWYHALTKDGVHWRRVSGFTTPEPDDILGVRFDGKTVFTDPNAPPEQRYKMFDGVHVMDFYTPQVVRYRHAQDAYFLFNCRYRSYEDWYLSEDMSQYKPTSSGVYNVGSEDIALAASRDGVSWERYDRSPWIRPGLAGSFDSKCMYMSRGIYVHGDEIWMYYIGIDDPHTGNPGVQDRYTFSRVVLRRDGFTCVEADYVGGEFVTPPLRFSGSGLFVNVDTSGVGLMRVELQDPEGRPIDGYAMGDCDRIHATNSTRHRVTWQQGRGDVSALSGTSVRIRVELQFGARLYAFRFDGAPDGGG